MFIIPSSNCIGCFFGDNSGNKSKFTSTKVEVFYGETESLNPRFSSLKNYITNDEQLRAGRFYSDKDRRTYITCHALLRLILSASLDADPLSLSFVKGTNGKPRLPDDPAFFNIAHTREAFVIAFTRDFPVGIDLEKIRDGLNIHSVSKAYFSKSENEYMQESKAEATDRFFLLWTRKEALLKAIGTGIINSLNDISVSEPVNFIKKESFESSDYGSALDEYYIYSLKLNDYYLSVAIPQKSSIRFNNLNEDNISGFLA